jgi:hypothetical protein
LPFLAAILISLYLSSVSCRTANYYFPKAMKPGRTLGLFVVANCFWFGLIYFNLWSWQIWP